MKTFFKQPNDHLDYDILASEWLPEGDIIIGAVVTPPTGIDHTGTVIEDEKVKIWVDGGTHGQSYKFSVVISTQAGREKEVDFNVRVRDL